MNVPAGGDKKNIVKMAYIYFQEGRWDKAIEEYKKLIAMDPEDINTLNMLGDVYVKKGSVKEAYESYSKVSADFTARGQIDKSAIVNKKIAALDSALLPAEAQKKQNLIKQSLKAETAMEAGDVDGAIDALNEVLKLDQENLGAYSKLAELFEKKGQLAEAVKQYQMLGAVFLKNRLYKKSQEMFQKVVQLDPTNVEGHNNLAQIYVKQGSESDAKKEYLNAAEQAMAVGDLEKANVFAAKAVEYKSIEAHYVLGVVLYKKQKLSESKAEFESLLRFKVNHVGALTHLGRVLLELGQADKAAESIQKALKAEKDNLPALEAWAEVCVKKGNKAEAVTTLLSLADKYSAKGEWNHAAEAARNALSIDENAASPLAKLADALRQVGDKPGAAEAFHKLGLLYEKQNKEELAAEAFKRTLEMNPSHAEAQKHVLGSVSAPPAPAHAKAPEAPAAPPPKTPPAGVLDLEDITAPPFGASKAPAPPPPAAPVHVEKPKPAPVEADPEEEIKAQITIADNYIKQGLVEEAIEIYQQLIETYPQRPELKQKLNQAYTAYVKTGEDVIGALEAEKKEKEEEEKHLRLEMEKKAQEESKRLREEVEHKARLETEKKVRAELERKAREEAETKAREEMEKRARQEAEHKAKEEVEHRAKVEAEKHHHEEEERKAKEAALQKSKEEAERKVREEMERKAKETAKKPAASAEFATSRTPPPSKGDSVEEGRDEFMTIAVADIYVRQGLHEEALKIYRKIVQLEPDNLEARKKLTDMENLIKSKGGKIAPETSAPPPPAKTPPSAPPSDEKDSGGKKKSNRVGYV